MLSGGNAILSRSGTMIINITITDAEYGLIQRIRAIQPIDNSRALSFEECADLIAPFVPAELAEAWRILNAEYGVRLGEIDAACRMLDEGCTQIAAMLAERKAQP
jgi:hypothetical protein